LSGLETSEAIGGADIYSMDSIKSNDKSPMSLSVKSVRYFIAVAEAESVTGATQTLNFTIGHHRSHQGAGK
jgi:hypothetical protein